MGGLDLAVEALTGGTVVWQAETDRDAAKVCPSCETELPFQRFRHNRSRPDGLHGECIQCANRRQASRKKAS